MGFSRFEREPRRTKGIQKQTYLRPVVMKFGWQSITGYSCTKSRNKATVRLFSFSLMLGWLTVGTGTYHE